MTDTPPDVRAAVTALVMRCSEGERAMMAFDMFNLAHALMIADIRRQHPAITDPELRVQIFERIVERIPGKVSGAWVFKGTRTPVATVAARSLDKRAAEAEASASMDRDD